jgi:hypothetical protein
VNRALDLSKTTGEPPDPALRLPGQLRDAEATPGAAAGIIDEGRGTDVTDIKCSAFGTEIIKNME